LIEIYSINAESNDTDVTDINATTVTNDTDVTNDTIIDVEAVATAAPIVTSAPITAAPVVTLAPPILPPTATPPPVTVQPATGFVEVHTTLANPVIKGSKTLDVVSIAGFQAGMPVTIGKGTTEEEYNMIAGFGSILLMHDLYYDHPAGVNIRQVSLLDSTIAAEDSSKGAMYVWACIVNFVFTPLWKVDLPIDDEDDNNTNFDLSLLFTSVGNLILLFGGIFIISVLWKGGYNTTCGCFGACAPDKKAGDNKKEYDDFLKQHFCSQDPTSCMCYRTVGFRDRTANGKPSDMLRSQLQGKRTCLGICMCGLAPFFACYCMYGMLMVHHEMKVYVPEVEAIRDDVRLLQQDMFNAGLWTKNWQENCPGITKGRPLMIRIAEAVEGLNSEALIANDKLKHLGDIIRKLRDRIDEVFDSGERFKGMVIMLTPSFLIMAFVSFILYVVDNERGNPNIIKFAKLIVLDCKARPLLVMFFFYVIYCWSFVIPTAARTALFCQDPEQHVVNLIKYYEQDLVITGTPEANLYITNFASAILDRGAHSNNDLFEMLQKMYMKIRPLAHDSAGIDPFLDTISMVCQSISDAHISESIDTADRNFEVIVPLSTREQVYDSFDGIVNRGICNHFLGGFSCFLLVQLITLLWLVPATIDMAYTYFLEMSQYYQAKEEEYEKKEKEELLKEVKKERKDRPTPFFCCGRTDGRIVTVSDVYPESRPLKEIYPTKF
jgi:hypothetical protein